MPDDKTDDLSSLQKLMDSVVGAKGDAASWPVTIVLLGLMTLILSVIGIKMALTKRAAAETARKLREQLEAERQARENEKLAINHEARQDAEEVIRQVESQIASLQGALDARKVEHEEYVKELNGLSDWDQIVVVDARNPNG